MTNVAISAITGAYELSGKPGAPLVVVLGGISAGSHVAATAVDPTHGWWERVVGARRSVDTSHFRVLGLDFLDAGNDARGPVSTHDQADALARVLDETEIARIHTLIGASYGGMVALAFAERYPERAGQLVVISAPARSHPMSSAIRGVQRGIVRLGLETGRAEEALALARALAMTTYRTPAEFGRRFERDPLAVQEYLRHHGDRFARRFSPRRFLALSLSADLHRVHPEHIRTPAWLVAAQGDTLVPREQMLDLAARWGGTHRFVELPTGVGHDAFLAEPERIGAILHNALTSPLHP